MVEQYLLSRHRWPILLEEANGMEDEDQGTNFVTSGRMSMRLSIILRGPHYVLVRRYHSLCHGVMVEESRTAL